MNYREMTISKGVKSGLGFWWYALGELALIVSMVAFLSDGEYLEGIAVVILIELRNISMKLDA
jgi:hypothetical protein